MTLKARITAIDRFIAGCKTDGIYDDLNAACIMAGWDGLAGALTPLKGTAPTNNGFLAADFDRGIGLKGDGSSKYLNSNVANNSDFGGTVADPQNDNHNAVYITAAALVATANHLTSDNYATGGNSLAKSNTNGVVRNRTSNAYLLAGAGVATGLFAVSRSSGSFIDVLASGVVTEDIPNASTSPVTSSNLYLFRAASGTAYPSDATIAFYSIGSSLGSDPATGLAALDARVSTLMADLRAIEESDFDADALTYIRAVEAADGAYLETDVKVAINKLVVGLKFDSLWDSILASCLLCGPRTLAGALVPLRNYGPELWDDSSPSFIVNSDGSAGTWDAATNTMVNAAVSTSNTRPRFDWGTALPAGKTVRITGRFSGDVSHIYRIAAGTATVVYQTDINPDGSFAATVVPTSSALYIYIDGTLAPTSVTIESLSIREVIDDPVNSPVGNGFVGGDYSRTDGLTGDGTSYLDTGRATNADPTSSMHLAVYPTAVGTTTLRAAGSYAPAGSDEVLIMSGDVRCRTRDTVSNVTVLADAIYGVSRSSSTEWYARGGQSDFAGSTGVAASANSRNMFIFAYNNDGSPFGISNATLAFYSIGTSLDLAKLDSHITAYVTAIGAAL